MFTNRVGSSALCFFLAGCCVPLSVAHAGPPVYRVVEIGTLGGARSEARGIGDGGHVVGWSETEAVDAQGHAIHRAFLWRDGELTDLGTLGGFQSEAYAVNGSGQIVGWADTATGNRHAFLWLPGPAYGLPQGMNDLNPPGSNRYQVATDINERGEVVGPSFLWLPNAAYSLSAGIQEIPFSPAAGIGLGSPRVNDLLQVVSAGSVWLPVPYYRLPAGWTSLFSGGPDDTFTSTALTNGGVVVGGISGIFQYFAAYDLPAGAWQYPVLSGFSSGTGANERGVLIGWSVDPDGPVLIERSPGGSVRVWVIRDRLLRAPDLRYAEPSGIDNLNRLIVNDGDFVTDYSRAMLWEPADTDINQNYPSFGATDSRDIRSFVRGIRGPDAPPAQCPRCDVDGDSDADLADFQALQLAFEP